MKIIKNIPVVIEEEGKETIIIEGWTGKIFRIKKNGDKKEVGSFNEEGYLCMGFKRHMIKNHKFVYEQYHNIKIPKDLTIDHISRDKTDNSIFNLRLANASLQAQNKDISNYSSKYSFVSRRKDFNKWRSRITINGKEYHLGYFEDEKEAFKTARYWAIKSNNELGTNIHIPD